MDFESTIREAILMSLTISFSCLIPILIFEILIIRAKKRDKETTINNGVKKKSVNDLNKTLLIILIIITDYLLVLFIGMSRTLWLIRFNTSGIIINSLNNGYKK